MKKNDLLKSKSFCIMPWVHLATEPTGEVKLCCLSSQRIADIDERPFNLGYDKVDNIYNSKYIRNARKKMLEGERISECSQCWREEDNGGISQRNTSTKNWLRDNPEFLDVIEKSKDDDFKVDHRPMYFDFRFGNLCNLKCRSCGSVNSTQINKEYTELTRLYPKQAIKFFSDSGEQYLTLNNWYKTETFFSNVYENIDKVKKIYVTGGEPTLIEENFNILKKIKSIGRANEVTIELNTNLTNLKDEFYDLIVGFKEVTVSMSVEGEGAIQEYLRYPSKWSQIDKNIKKLASMPDNVRLLAVPVIQLVNLDRITDFFQYIDDINIGCNKNRILLLPIILNEPKFLDLMHLPLGYKLKCWENIQKVIEESVWIKTSEYSQGRFSNLKSKCMVDNFDAHLLKHFKEFTDILDNHRGQSLKLVNPELYKILENV